MEYKEIVEKILSETPFNDGDIFEYDGTPCSDEFDATYKFYYQALERHAHYGIEPLSDSVGAIWWIPPEDYGSLLTFLSNELLNSISQNPFEEVLNLYISKWEPSDTIDKCLPYDLERVIEADPKLSQDKGKSSFFEQFHDLVTQRRLVWV